MNVMTSQLNRRSFLLFGMLVVVFAAASLTSLIISFKTGWADSFPNKPIRIIVPYPAGGIVDARARWIAERLSKNIGQHVIVDNRPGASTIIGADAMVRAAPDGYTLLLSSTSTFVTIPQQMKQLPYDPAKDLLPLTPTSATGFVLVTHPSLGVKSVADLIALAKASPGKLNFASPGNGTVTHIVSEAFKYAAGIDIRHGPAV